MINTFPTEGNLSGLSRKDFQKDINDKKTDLFILKNKKGMEVAVTNYGCAILSIMVPDKDGKYANVVLSYGTLDALMHGPEPFLSTTIGSPKVNSPCMAKNIVSRSTTVPTHFMVAPPDFTPEYGMPSNLKKG